MPLDAPVVAALAREIHHKLPLKVDRIYQPYSDEFLIGLFGAGVSSRLLLSLNAQFGRVHFFEGTRENPLSPTPFCMLLRKHLGSAKLVACEAAIPFERIIKLTFETYDPYAGLCHKVIWLELTGKSANLILADQQGRIIESWRKSAAAGRELFSGAQYQPPGTGERWKPVTITASQFQTLLSQIPPEISLEKFLLKHWYGLSALAVREIAGDAGFTPATPCGAVRGQSGVLYDSFQAWAEMIAGQSIAVESFQPTGLFNGDGLLIDYAAFPVHHPPQDLEARTIPALNRAVAQVANCGHEASRFQLRQQTLLKKIRVRLDKESIKLGKQETESLAAEQAEQWRIAGELLTIYQHQITKGSKEIKLVNHYDPDGQELAISLNPALSPSANAQAYFKKYQKAKKGQREIALQIGKTRENIAYLESIVTMVDGALNEADLRMVEEELNQTAALKNAPQGVSRSQNKSRPGGLSKETAGSEPRRFTTPAGHQILVGRNNLQNDKLTFKIASPNDLWFHTQKIPGSHVILKAQPGVAVDDASLNFACQLAAYFSQAKGSTKIPVDYTERKNVKKPPGAKPGFVIYDHFKTAIISPDERLLTGLGLPV